MPARTKALKANSIGDPRVVYVSCALRKHERPLISWMEKFFERLAAAAGGLEQIKSLLDSRTPPRDVTRDKWVDSVLETVTDFVGIVTNHYLIANGASKHRSSDDELLPPELARIIERAQRPLVQKKGHLVVWLAPLDPPLWRSRISEVWLDDPDRVHNWLIRLKEDKMFVLPGENPGRSAVEIAEAVQKIVGWKVPT